LTEADPLIDTAQCKRDATLMATLHANAIRVYHVDPDGDHSGCMTAFADAGIYLLVDLDTFTTDIDPVCPPPFLLNEKTLTGIAPHRVVSKHV
jgi:hypothetical protein